MDVIASRNLRPPLGPATRFVDPATFPEPGRTAVVNAVARARANLAEEFKGISVDGKAPPGLFPISKTGVSTQAIVGAVNAFVSLLTPVQRNTVCFPIDSNQWRAWQNMHCFLAAARAAA
jgi:uncharacterized protein DUF3500